MSLFGIASAAILAATAAYHSAIGERRVIAAVAALEPDALAKRPRRAIRFTWHLASILILMTAATIAWPGTPARLVGLIGGAWLAVGLAALWLTGGRHPSGPAFTAAGLLALAEAA